jgi:hypothetical protein
MRAIGLAAILLLVPAFASAQYGYDSHWNASGPHPVSCLFNGVEFYLDDDVCVGAGVKQVCLGDGSLGARQLDETCKGPETPRPSITRFHGRDEVACTFNQSSFSVGAEICVGRTTKRICQPNGALGASQSEPSCYGPVLGAGG